MALTENGLTRIELGKEQLSHLPFQVLFKSQALEKTTLNTSSSEDQRKISGFTVNWFLKDSNGTQTTEKLPARQEDWKREVPIPAFKDPLFQDMVELAKELRSQNMTKEEILTEVIYRKLRKKHDA